MATSTPTSTPDVTELPIEAIHVSGRHRKNLGNIAELAASFEASRMAQPPVKPVRRRRKDPAVTQYF